jgi:hypothetical protein
MESAASSVCISSEYGEGHTSSMEDANERFATVTLIEEQCVLLHKCGDLTAFPALAQVQIKY